MGLFAGPGILRRGIIAVLAIVVAWQSYQFALVPNLRMVDPNAAIARNPGDPVALSKIVNKRIETAGSYQSNDDDLREAYRSLVNHPLSRASLRIIGMNADMEGDSATALQAMELSHRISRRDTFAQIWLLERAAAVDDFDGILEHTHASLSVTPELGVVLKPTLLAAIQYAEVRDVIQRYMVLNSRMRLSARWTLNFLGWASREGRIEDLLSLSLPVAQNLSGEEYRDPMARIIYRLAANGEWNEAMRLAEATWGNFDAVKFGKVEPSEATSDPRLGLLSWELAATGGIQAHLVPNGGFEVSLQPLSVGKIAQRSFPVSGGHTYTLRQRPDFHGGERVFMAWQADCISSDGAAAKRIWEQTVPVSQDPISYRSQIELPTECNLLELTLAGSGPDGQTAALLTVNEFDLFKAGN